MPAKLESVDSEKLGGDVAINPLVYENAPIGVRQPSHVLTHGLALPLTLGREKSAWHKRQNKEIERANSGACDRDVLRQRHETDFLKSMTHADVLFYVLYRTSSKAKCPYARIVGPCQAIGHST